MAQNEYNLGDQIGPINYMISEKDVSDFISINESRDSFKRFTSKKHAETEKFPISIVPGNMHLIVLSDFLISCNDNIVIKKMDMIFRHIMKQNIQLYITGFITNLLIEDNIKTYECDITVKTDENITLIIANSKFIIK